MKLYLNERESKNENPRLESRGFFIIFIPVNLIEKNEENYP
jgi:hypothetical protein